MKWFQHECDALTHPDLEAAMDMFGSDGYTGYFGTLEIIGKYGDGFLRLSLEKFPKKSISTRLRIKETTLTEIWGLMGKRNALSSNLLKKGVLYSPGLKKRADEYTKKLQTKSGQHRDNIRLHYNTLQDIRIHYITTKGWRESDLHSDDYGRIHKAGKTLFFKARKNLKLLKACIEWVSNRGYCDWTLETCIKKWPDFLKYIEVVQAKDKQGKEAQEKFQKMKQEAVKEGLIPKEKLDTLIKQALKE